MSVPALNADFRDIITALRQEHADFLVVGAYALAVHGVPRATGDLDVLIRPTAENAAKVWSALLAFGAPLEALGIALDDFTRPDTVVQLGVPPRRIDLLTAISGVDFDAAWDSRVQTMMDEIPVNVLSRETLIRNKRAAGRAKDIADIEALEQE